MTAAAAVRARVRASVARRLRPGGAARPTLPFGGWPPASGLRRPLDELSDQQVAELNAMLPWSCFTVDRHGRRLGEAAWQGKRMQPQELPDPRITRLNELVDLSDKDVLEVGCFEGVHTIALCDSARSVVAVDARTVNVAKTAVRCALYGVRPTIRTVDVEREPPDSALWQADVVHHVGVLYHLVDPVSHLRSLASSARTAIMLDTHVARPEEAEADYESGGQTYRVRIVGEGGPNEVFSGTGPFARWLLLDDLRRCLEDGGLTVEVEELRQERNGERVLVIARR